MPAAPTFDAVFAVMQAAAAGDLTARVPVPADPDVENVAVKLAITLNLLLDDLSFRTKERAGFEERLRQSQKMEAIGNLAGGIAHDFNNLLSVILGYTDLATTALPEGDPIANDLAEVQAAAERAKRLTTQLLTFSRKRVLESEPLDLNAVLHGMEGMLARLLGETIELRFATTGDPGTIQADRSQLEQVILNLCVNARDGMPNGGKLTLATSNVELDASFAADVVPGPYVLFAVTDTGIGMSAAVRERIFEPFFTTKEPGHGTGLGLATVFGIVKQSGGHIGVESEAGSGSTFKVHFPRASAVPARPAAPARPPASPPERASETVLLVEDLDSLRAMAHAILTRSGYRVLEAGGGEAALEVARSHSGPIHLLLSDVVMPHMTGPALAASLRAVRPELRVLFMSGYTDGAIAHHGLLDPGTDFVQKPLTPDTLLRKVRDALTRPA